MPYRAILFDLDGTLLNTLDDQGDAMNRVLAKRGFPTHTLYEYRSFIGDGATILITRALPEGSRNDHIIRTCLQAFLEDYGRNWNVKTKPYGGIPEMLDALTARGLKLAVLSNKPHGLTNRCVIDLLSKWTFDVILGQRNGVPRKPDPAGALEISDYLNMPPKEFLYLGDSAVDIKTAVAAGMFPVGVLWGFRSAQELQENGAQALIEDPLEILNLL